MTATPPSLNGRISPSPPNSSPVSRAKAAAASLPGLSAALTAKPSGTLRLPLTAMCFGHGMIDTGTGGSAGTCIGMVPRLRTPSLPSSRVGMVSAGSVLPSARMTKPAVAPSVQWRMG